MAAQSLECADLALLRNSLMCEDLQVAAGKSEFYKKEKLEENSIIYRFHCHATKK